MFSFIKNTHLSQKILLALILGLLTGFIFGEKIAFLKILGDIFIRLIKMIIVPLTFLIITDAFMNVSNAGKMGKLAIKCIIFYCATTAFTTMFGIVVATLAKPGAGIVLTPDFFANSTYKPPVIGELNFMKIIANMFPSNIFESMLNADILQILIFSCFFGIAINKVHESGPVKDFIKSITGVVMKIVEMVIKFTPFGVFGIAAYLAGTQDLKLLKSLGLLFICLYGSVLFITYVFYGLILAFFGLDPRKFFRKVFQVQYFTYLTAASAAAMPLTKITCERKLGVSKETASLTVPLGAAFNLDGSALHLGITSVFLSQIFGLDLGLIDYGKILFLSVILTVGMAGVPGATLIAMPLILVSIGIPPEYIAIYVGIDRFLDMARSSLNVVGDTLVSVIMDKSTGNLNKEVYNNSEEVDIFKIREEENKA